MKTRLAVTSLALLALTGCGSSATSLAVSSLDQDPTALGSEEFNPQVFEGVATKTFTTKIKPPADGDYLRVRGTCAETLMQIKFAAANFEKEFEWRCDPAFQDLDSNGVSLAKYLPDEAALAGPLTMEVTTYRDMRSEAQITQANAAQSTSTGDFWKRATDDTQWTVTLSASPIPK